MPVANMQKLGLDRPIYEQLDYAPATGIAGTSITDDGLRYIYAMFQTSATAAQFWRYDSWGDSWQQLATPATQTGSLGKTLFTPSVGTQWSGKCYGSVYAFMANGTTCYWYKYDIATNTWASALSTTNVPAAFGTDCYICYPQVMNNNFAGGYHSGVTMTITTSGAAAVGATSVAVNALSAALAANTVLDFGMVSVTLSAAAAKGTKTLTVTSLTNSIAAGAVLTHPDGYDIIVSTAASAGATSLLIYPLIQPLASGAVITARVKAALTASAAAAATSITVSGLLFNIASAATAYHYDHMYLIGNNATVMYRYTIATNAWATTSANSGTPAMPALTGSAGAGCAIKWLPAYAGDKLWILRGGATATTYIYDLVANTWSTETYYPATETFTTGTWVAARSINGVQTSLIIQKDATMRLYEGVPALNTLECKGHQWLASDGAAVVGDRMGCVTTPQGIEFLYMLLHSSTSFIRKPLIDG